MPYGMYAECPKCGTKATGKNEIERVFGFRYDGTKPQSWCRACRSSANKIEREQEDISTEDNYMGNNS